MIDELPAALEYTLSTTHHLYILSLPEQKLGQPHTEVGSGKEMKLEVKEATQQSYGSYGDPLDDEACVSLLASQFIPCHIPWFLSKLFWLAPPEGPETQGNACHFNDSTILEGFQSTVATSAVGHMLESTILRTGFGTTPGRKESEPGGSNF
jgi:hypothetical protein